MVILSHFGDYVFFTSYFYRSYDAAIKADALMDQIAGMEAVQQVKNSRHAETVVKSKENIKNLKEELAASREDI